MFATLPPGAEWPGRYLEISWEWLLKNHPHDSICGCSIDQVHEDMKYRFGQSRQIAARLADSARECLTASVEGSPGDRELRVSVFNPLAVTRTGPAEIVLEIPADWPEFTDEFGFENKPAVHDARRGLAVVGDGALLESGVRDTPDRPILLTLYRSTGRTVMTQGQPNGQLLGHEMTFRYRIAPLRGAPDRAALFRLAQDLAGGIETCQMVAKDVGLKKPGASLPAQDSLIEVAGDAIMTSARLEGKSLEVRLFNPYGHGVRSAVRAGFSLDVQRSRIVDFLSQPVKFKITRRSRTVGFLLKPKQILTVSLPVSQ